MTRKLGIRPGDRVVALGAPPHLRNLLGALPEGSSLVIRPETDSPPCEGDRGTQDVVLVFCPDTSSLAGRFDRGRRLLKWDGGLWACWPKLSSPLARDLRESDIRSHGLAAGLVDNKVCALDPDWSGLRFVYRREDRPGGRRATSRSRFSSG